MRVVMHLHHAKPPDLKGSASMRGACTIAPMAEAYDFRSVERKWQERWEREGIYRARSGDARPKYYVCEMLPYPSGDLHVGHAKNYTIGDAIARMMRMLGYNVLHPMGWDAFGLPAENAAIARGIDPAEWTSSNIANMERQMRVLGTSYDWTRELATSSPEYYRWNQWLFLRLYEQGLAYKREAPVNWCPHDKTVLANEQVEDGRCWRCHHLVERRNLSQWFLKITAYADRLLADLDELPGWPERTIAMQRNWIGRSEGVRFGFRGRRARCEPRRFHDARRHGLRRDVFGGRARAPARRAHRNDRRARSRQGDRIVRRESAFEVGTRAHEPHGEAGLVHRRLRDQSALGNAGPDLGDELRAGGVRHRCRDGRARARRARLRVRAPQRTADRARRSHPPAARRPIRSTHPSSTTVCSSTAAISRV